MSDTGQKINYTLRPAKCVERKVICELLARFHCPVPIHEYRYIGFGSFYFSDFVLFHNYLNIDNMISIEHSQNEERYKFNKPYKNIEMYFGDAGTAFSHGIDFSDPDIKNIIWLDYDSAFQQSMISDLITVSGKISSGSFVFITLNPSLQEDQAGFRLPYLQKEAGDYLPKLKEKDIAPNTIPTIIYDIFSAAVQKALLSRNVKEAGQIKAMPIFFIKYKDNARMLTIGYYYTDDAGWEAVLPTLANIPWVTTDREPRNLVIPCLTKGEIRELNRMIPGTPAAEIHKRMPYLTVSDIEKYIMVYKYYPNYSDSLFYA